MRGYRDPKERKLKLLIEFLNRHMNYNLNVVSNAYYYFDVTKEIIIDNLNEMGYSDILSTILKLEDESETVTNVRHEYKGIDQLKSFDPIGYSAPSIIGSTANNDLKVHREVIKPLVKKAKTVGPTGFAQKPIGSIKREEEWEGDRIKDVKIEYDWDEPGRIEDHNGRLYYFHP